MSCEHGMELEEYCGKCVDSYVAAAREEGKREGRKLAFIDAASGVSLVIATIEEFASREDPIAILTALKKRMQEEAEKLP